MALVHIEVNDARKTICEEECCDLELDANIVPALKRLIDDNYIVTLIPMEVWLS